MNQYISKKIDICSSPQREKLLGLAKRIYEAKNDERANHLIRTIANSYSSEKDGRGATLTTFLDDRNPIMRSLAERAYELTPHGKNKIWDYHAPVIQPVLRKDLKAVEDLERFKVGQDELKNTSKYTIEKPKKNKIEIETNRPDLISEKDRNLINIEPRKKFSDKYEETYHIKEYERPFKEDKKISGSRSLDTQILDIFSTLRFGKMTAENLKIANYFSNVGKKCDPMPWIRGFRFNKTFGLR